MEQAPHSEGGGTAGRAGDAAPQAVPAVLAALLESDPDPVFSLDRAFRYTSFNAAHASVMKALYGADIGLGHTLFEYQTVPADVAGARANLERALAGETLVDAAYSGAEGLARREYEVVHRPVREDGAVTGVLVTARDVTGQRRERMARRIHERALEASINAIALSDLEWKITYVNPAFLKLWGYDDLGEVIGRPVGEFWDSRDDAFAVRDAMLRTGGWAGELTGSRRDGSTFFASVTTSLVKDDDDVPIGALAAVVDISGAVHTEGALRESEARLRSVLKNLQDAYFRAGPDGVLNFVSDSAAAMFGYDSPDQMLGLPAASLYAEPGAREAMLAQLRTTGSVRDFRTRGLRRDGSAFWTDLSVQLVRGEDGAPLGTEGLARDVSDRVRAEQALSESEAQLRGILDSLQDGYVRVSPDGVILFASRSLADLFGYESPDQMVGLQAVSVYAHPEDRDEMRREFARTGRLDEFVFKARRRDGSTFWAAMNVQPFRGPDGQVRGTEGLIRDTTARVLAEAALRTSERRLDEIAEQSRTWAWEVDADGVYTYVSHVVETVLGYGPADLVGVRHFYDLHLGEGREAFKAAALAIFSRKDPFHGLENRAVAADGRTVWLYTNGIPMLGDDGELLGYRGSDTDITEHRQAELELRRFRLMVDRANYGAAAATRDGTLVYVNEAMATMHGWTVADLTGCHLTACHSEEQMPRVGQMLELIARDGGFTAQEVWHARKDGSVFPTLMNAFFIEGAEGEPPLQAVSMVEISDLKRAEDQIRLLNADLERRVRERTADLRAANKELEAFSYSVSHDLRQPLRAIDGFCQILWEDEYEQLGEEGRANLERVRAAAQRMGRLIDDLLSLSRLSRRDVYVDDVDLSALVAAILGSLAEADPERRVDTVVRPGCVVRSDPGLVEVIVDNLLRNAWKFTSRRPLARIEFGEADDDGTRVFFVRDDGAGFDPAYADKLFRPFSRLHHESEFSGNGIGLATVQRVVSRLGGRCWAEGVAGEGATFFFSLGTPDER